MKLASFIALSASLHGIVLILPISFPALNGEPAARAIVVTLDETGGTRGNAIGAPKQLPQPTPRPAVKTTPLAPLIADRAEAIPPNPPAPVVQDSMTVEKGLEVPPPSDSNFSAASFTIAGAVGGSRNAGGGTGQSDTHSGLGSGRGIASANDQYTRASYRETPKPRYPETARREGQEGRVLLRVLVSEDGRSAAVEVNRSSGVEALDQAAVAAIKRWRFVPARSGDQPVQSWVRIPIDFRLTDAGD